MKKNDKLIKLFVCSMIVVSMALGAGLAFAGESSVMGTVEQTDDGLVIQADDGTYIVAGQDLSGMVGKKVKATGTVSEGDKGKTLTVLSIEEIQE